MSRRSADVLQQLLDELACLVTDYHPEVARTGRNVADLIQGTAFFPGGSGIWRGDRNGGNLPETFPEAPIMFVAHNFDKKGSHDAAMLEGGEVESPFWRTFWLPILNAARVEPEDCFFTNVLMGLQPQVATGKMPAVNGYKEQCQLFLRRQIEIVQPRVVVTLGGDARNIARSIVSKTQSIRHPSDSYHFSARATRQSRIVDVGERLQQIVSGAASFKVLKSIDVA